MSNIQKARSILKECTAKIVISSSEFGTGFFVGVGVLMTCLHVVANYNDKSFIIWKNKKYSITKILSPNKDCDISLVYSEINNTEYVLVGLDAKEDIKINQQLFSYAFCENYDHCIPVEMTFEGMDEYYYTVKGGQILPGMSGSAVLDESTGLICGIIKRTRDANSDLGGRIIPITRDNIRTINFSPPITRNIFINNRWYQNLDEWQINNYVNFWDKFATQDDLKSEIIECISTYKESLFSNFISGSKRIRIKNLFSNGLIQQFSGCDIYYNKITNLKEYILSIIHDNNKKGVIICSDPGIGKTTLNYDIFFTLIEKCKNFENSILPLFIDLSSYEIDDEYKFGTFDWLKKYLSTTYNISESLFRYVISLRKNVVFIFESIDEYLSRFTISTIKDYFSREMFSDTKIVLSCRKYNYEGYLCSVKSLRSLEYTEISGLNKEQIRKYLNSYLKLLKKGRKQKKRIKKMIFNSSNIYQLAFNPLHLNMIIDLVSRNTKTIDQINGIKSLYDNYVKEWLYLEDSKYHATDKYLSYDEIIILLEKISLSFFEEYQIGREENITFTLEALENLINTMNFKYETKAILNQIINSTLLLQDRTNNRTNLKFIHKSFQEYFIASYVFHAMLNNSEQLSEIMRMYYSAYISEFLREFMQESSNISLKRNIASNCKKAYQYNLPNTDESFMPQKKIAREQLAYYMGNLHLQESDDFLISMIDRETDIWVKRGILFGLCFGENQKYEHTYLDILRNERKDGTSTVENDCNTGFTLSFFGDQPFDVFCPESNNLEYTDCSKTINRILYLLGTESDYYAWRLNLYIIIDLYKYRYVSKNSVIENLKKNSSLVTEIIDKMKKDSRSGRWPEVVELESIMSEIKL